MRGKPPLFSITTVSPHRPPRCLSLSCTSSRRLQGIHRPPLYPRDLRCGRSWLRSSSLPRGEGTDGLLAGVTTMAHELTDAVISVFTKPGDIVLTLIFCCIVSEVYRVCPCRLYIFGQLFGDRWTHRPDRAFCPTVCRTQLTAHSDMTCHTCDENDTSMSCLVRNHLLGCKLCGEVKTHHIDGQQILMILVCEFEEWEMAIDSSTRDTYIECIVKVLLELCEAPFKRLLGRNVDPNEVSDILLNCA